MVFQVNMVLLQVFLRSLKELHGHQAEPLLLEVLDAFTHQVMLHAVWPDGHNGTLEVSHGPQVGCSASVGNEQWEQKPEPRPHLLTFKYESEKAILI